MSDKAYFKKSLVFNPVYVDGKAVEWIRTGRHDGLLETSSPSIIKALTKLSTEGRLGVVQLTEAEFEELKKNPAIPLPNPYERLRGLDQPPTPLQPAPVPAAAPEPAKPAPQWRARQAAPSTTKGVFGA